MGRNDETAIDFNTTAMTAVAAVNDDGEKKRVGTAVRTANFK